LSKSYSSTTTSRGIKSPVKDQTPEKVAIPALTQLKKRVTSPSVNKQESPKLQKEAEVIPNATSSTVSNSNNNNKKPVPVNKLSPLLIKNEFSTNESIKDKSPSDDPAGQVLLTTAKKYGFKLELGGDKADADVSDDDPQQPTSARADGKIKKYRKKTPRIKTPRSKTPRSKAPGSPSTETTEDSSTDTDSGKSKNDIKHKSGNGSSGNTSARSVPIRTPRGDKKAHLLLPNATVFDSDFDSDIEEPLYPNIDPSQPPASHTRRKKSDSVDTNVTGDIQSDSSVHPKLDLLKKTLHK